MNEENKSIFKRSLKGWRAWLMGLVTIVATPVVVAAIIFPMMGAHLSGDERALIIRFAEYALVLGVMLLLLRAAVRWLCCWRNFRRFALALALLVTFIAAFYTEEDWRGRWAWKNYVREQAAKGETLDPTAFIPPPVPDEQNFCMCPMLKPLLDFTMTNNSLFWQETNGIARIEALHPWFNPRGGSFMTTNTLADWQNYYRSLTNLAGLALTNSAATDVLLVLNRFEPDLAELKREAERRPLDRWAVKYDLNDPWEIWLPHDGNLKGICSLLRVRATAFLAAGDAQRAQSDLELGFRVADSVRTEPFLISHLVRDACYEVLLPAVQEGLSQHAFSDAQLAELQGKLQSVDLLAGHQTGMRGERTFHAVLINLSLKKIIEILSYGYGKGEWPELNFAFLAPRGWIYQNQLRVCQLYDDYLIPELDLDSRRVDMERVKALSAAVQQITGPFSVLTHLEFDPKTYMGEQRFKYPRVAHSQTLVDEAAVACALERYRLTHGDYPENLEGLAPQYMDKLPHDVIKGGPLHYRKLEDGKFLLYSIGWNESDDGGTVARKKGGGLDLEQGDWVWGQQ